MLSQSTTLEVTGQKHDFQSVRRPNGKTGRTGATDHRSEKASRHLTKFDSRI